MARDTSAPLDPDSFKLAEAMAHLARAPILLGAWFESLPLRWATLDEGGETWSAVEIIGYLVYGEQVDWMPRLQRVLKHGAARPFETFDRWGHQRETAGVGLSELIEEFRRLRLTNLRELKDLALQPADLERQGRHPEFGLVTVRQLLAAWVVHDLDHVAQIARVFAHQYTEAVGPWSAYLRILSGQRT